MIKEEKIKKFEEIYADTVVAFVSFSLFGNKIKYPLLNDNTELNAFERAEFIRWCIKKKNGRTP